MSLNVEKELAELRQLPPRALRDRYARVFGEATNSHHKDWLVKRIIWRMQALEQGDLSERARRRAAEIANDADLRRRPPQTKANSSERMVVVMKSLPVQPTRVPPPGGSIVRDYKGRKLEVHVREQGFEFEGQFFKSLSAVAKHVTGSHCNGFHFFRLTQWGGDQ